MDIDRLLESESSEFSDVRTWISDLCRNVMLRVKLGREPESFLRALMGVARSAYHTNFEDSNPATDIGLDSLRDFPRDDVQVALEELKARDRYGYITHQANSFQKRYALAA